MPARFIADLTDRLYDFVADLRNGGDGRDVASRLEDLIQNVNSQFLMGQDPSEPPSLGDGAFLP